MMDNFTPGPAGEASPTQAVEAQFREELFAAGVPEHLHDWLAGYGIGALVVKMGIRFLEMSPERCVATMPVEGNTQVAGILHGGAHVVLAETLWSFAESCHLLTFAYGCMSTPLLAVASMHCPQAAPMP